MPSADSITFRPRDMPHLDDKDTACKSLAQPPPGPTWGPLSFHLSHSSTQHRSPPAGRQKHALRPGPPHSSPLLALRRGCDACSWVLGRGSGRSGHGCLGRPRSQAAGRGQAEVTSGRGPSLEAGTGADLGAPSGESPPPQAAPPRPTLATRRLHRPEGRAPDPAPGRPRPAGSGGSGRGRGAGGCAPAA